MGKIKEALQKRFQDHRVIFWYDGKNEFQEEFKELKIPSVNQIKVEGNEFELKYQIYKETPEQKFLLYIPYEKPANEENWLLDVELAFHVFHTDQEAMVLQELGLGYHLKELIGEHVEFFKSKERKQKFQQLIVKGDEHHALRCKLLAVVFNTESTNLVNFVHSYALAVVDDKAAYGKQLERYNLRNFFWDEIGRVYNYQSTNPSIYDFLLDVFKQNFVLGENLELNRESRLILSSWKDTLPYRNYYLEVSAKIAGDLQIEEKLTGANLQEIINDDLFELTDQKIIHDLIAAVDSEEISVDKLNDFIKRRENKFWYSQYETFYKSIFFGSRLINLAAQNSGHTYKNFSEATKDYSKRLYEVDFVYRKFIWHYRQANHNPILSVLADKVEKVYSNSWLLTYNNNWQNLIDPLPAWPTKGRESQQGFFQYHAKPVLDKNQKLFVIISDALRFECGAELNELIKAENRFDSNLEYLVSSLPSYTQLGMASLLPHTNIELKENGDSIVIDGMSASGIQGRIKILQENSGVRATAIKADELMNMNVRSGGEGREFVKQHDLIYVYHNRIDKTGDDKTSEERVFDAVEEELSYIKDLLKKIAGLNGTNVYITADHGFIYQNQKLAESDFSLSAHEGDIWKENRRFVIGKNLKGDKATKLFKASELNIGNDGVEVLIPKSINRLRIKGAGSRFIHGGASPQETIIPLLKTVVRKRQNTVSQVEIDIIKSTDKITTNILPVSFIQSNLVGETVLPREIRAGLYAEDKELLSDQFKFNFNIEEGSERQREVKHNFQLSKKASSSYKNQRIKLILEEPLEATNKWKKYKEFYYTLNITFSNDFD